MKEEMMTTGFTGGDAATGPAAGYDPVMKFRRSVKDKKKKKEMGYHVMPDGTMMPGKVHEDRQRPELEYRTSRLFQYKVAIPTVGETILYANSPAELMQKLRLLINPRLRSEISIERIMPVAAAQFFMNKRMKHMRNVSEAMDKGMQQQVTQQQIANEKKKVQLKVQELQKQLQQKTAALKMKARVGGAQATVDQ